MHERCGCVKSIDAKIKSNRRHKVKCNLMNGFELEIFVPERGIDIDKENDKTIEPNHALCMTKIEKNHDRNCNNNNKHAFQTSYN